jgi:hypothetical protein
LIDEQTHWNLLLREKTVPEYYEGPEAGTRFRKAVDQVLAVSREEIECREKEYQVQQALKPKRGPKRKVKPSASGHESGGKD